MEEKMEKAVRAFIHAALVSACGYQEQN